MRVAGFGATTATFATAMVALIGFMGQPGLYALLLVVMLLGVAVFLAAGYFLFWLYFLFCMGVLCCDCGDLETKEEFADGLGWDKAVQAARGQHNSIASPDTGTGGFQASDQSEDQSWIAPKRYGPDSRYAGELVL